MGSSLPKKLGAKKLKFLRFLTTLRCNGEYLLKEDNRARAWLWKA